MHPVFEHFYDGKHGCERHEGSTRVARGWHEGGTRVARGWHEGGTRVARGWHEGGTRVARGWHEGGTRVAREWHEEDRSGAMMGHEGAGGRHEVVSKTPIHLFLENKPQHSLKDQPRRFKLRVLGV
jgi:hypothetical protein